MNYDIETVELVDRIKKSREFLSHYGNRNVFIGYLTGNSISTGSQNFAYGYNCGVNTPISNNIEDLIIKLKSKRHFIELLSDNSYNEIQSLSLFKKFKNYIKTIIK
jgi:hypothetical protein